MISSSQDPTIAYLQERQERTVTELARVRIELTQERIKNARSVTALANVALALEQGTPVPEILASIRIALRITPGGQSL